MSASSRKYQEIALLVLLAAIDRQLLIPAGIVATVLGYIGSRSYGIYLPHYAAGRRAAGLRARGVDLRVAP